MSHHTNLEQLQCHIILANLEAFIHRYTYPEFCLVIVIPISCLILVIMQNSRWGKKWTSSRRTKRKKQEVQGGQQPYFAADKKLCEGPKMFHSPHCKCNCVQGHWAAAMARPFCMSGNGPACTEVLAIIILLWKWAFTANTAWFWKSD